MTTTSEVGGLSNALSALSLGVGALALDSLFPRIEGVFAVAVYRIRYEGEGEAKVARGELVSLEDAKALLPHGLALPCYFTTDFEAMARMRSVQTLLNWLPAGAARLSARMFTGHPPAAF